KSALSRQIDIFGADNSFWRQFEEPRQHHGDRETKDEPDNDKAHRRIWDVEERKNLRRDLGQQPSAHAIENCGAVNIAPLQLGKQIVDLHCFAPAIFCTSASNRGWL